jgi:hypothetical protein
MLSVGKLQDTTVALATVLPFAAYAGSPTLVLALAVPSLAEGLRSSARPPLRRLGCSEAMLRLSSPC